MLVKDISVPSSDGRHELKGKLYLPDAEPAGTVQIVHGMSEHIGRYDGFMTKLCGAGYIVFGHDQIGHGATARAAAASGGIEALDRELGFIARRGGWKILLKDIETFRGGALEYITDNGFTNVRALPFTLFGHSMGSLEVRLAAVSQDPPDKLIVMGTAGPNPVGIPGRAVAGIVKTFRGPARTSPFLEKLIFGSYNERFGSDPDPDMFSWLSTLKSTRVNYISDKFCGFSFKNAALCDLITLNNRPNARSWYKKFPKNVPTLLISGGEDPVGAYGEGVKKVFESLSAAGADVRLRIVPGERHELLNEAGAEDTVAEIIGFIKG